MCTTYTRLRWVSSSDLFCVHKLGIWPMQRDCVQTKVHFTMTFIKLPSAEICRGTYVWPITGFRLLVLEQTLLEMPYPLSLPVANRPHCNMLINVIPPLACATFLFPSQFPNIFPTHVHWWSCLHALGECWRLAGQIHELDRGQRFASGWYFSSSWGQFSLPAWLWIT